VYARRVLLAITSCTQHDGTRCARNHAKQNFITRANARRCKSFGNTKAFRTSDILARAQRTMKIIRCAAKFLFVPTAKMTCAQGEKILHKASSKVRAKT
jgi:hypothetical protein